MFMDICTLIYGYMYTYIYIYIYIICTYLHIYIFIYIYIYMYIYIYIYMYIYMYIYIYTYIYMYKQFEHTTSYSCHIPQNHIFMVISILIYTSKIYTYIHIYIYIYKPASWPYIIRDFSIKSRFIILNNVFESIVAKSIARVQSYSYRYINKYNSLIMYICTYMYMYIYILCTYMYVYMRIYIYVYIHMN
jgi:hypothetical protein